MLLMLMSTVLWMISTSEFLTWPTKYLSLDLATRCLLCNGLIFYNHLYQRWPKD